jgi:hypothetical protein
MIILFRVMRQESRASRDHTKREKSKLLDEGVGRYLGLIDGEGSHSGTGIHRRPFGFDIDAGVTLAWPSARIGFTFVRRSREFSEQDKPDRFGQLTIALAY